MTDNLFEAMDQLPTVDQNKNYLEDLVGEGKKFKDHESLARGKYESDLYIKHLTDKLDEMRKDYVQLRESNMSGASLQELVDQMKQLQSERTNNADEGNTNEPTFKPEQIEQLVQNKLQDFEQERTYKQNFNSVMSKLKERFGNNYQSVLKTQVEALGLDQDTVNDLARKHPSVLIRTLGLDSETPREDFQSPPRTNVNSEGFKPVTKKRTWSYYQALKIKDPNAYYDPKINVQMLADAKALGPEFEDGDFHAR